jgi:hypothetical protein
LTAATKRFTGARPVRFERGAGWVECLPHMAQRWQAVLAGRVLHAAPYAKCKQAAMQLVTANALRHKPVPRNYKLGKRMEKKA